MNSSILQKWSMEKSSLKSEDLFGQASAITRLRPQKSFESFLFLLLEGIFKLYWRIMKPNLIDQNKEEWACVYVEKHFHHYHKF